MLVVPTMAVCTLESLKSQRKTVSTRGEAGQALAGKNGLGAIPQYGLVACGARFFVEGVGDGVFDDDAHVLPAGGLDEAAWLLVEDIVGELQRIVEADLDSFLCGVAIGR